MALGLNPIMREFPPIDDEAEDAALRTLFFNDSEFEGKKCKLSIANYLAFLSMRGAEVQDEIAIIRTALAEPSKAHLEHDISRLLLARNWRFHNIACVAIACTGASEYLLSELWRCIKAGSWSAPQLAATAAYIDTDFQRKATELIEDHSTYYKSIVALAGLLSEGTEVTALTKISHANIDEAATIDRDNSGSIAIRWRKNLIEAFRAARIDT